MEKLLRYIVIILLLFIGIESVGILLMLQSLYRMEEHINKLHKEADSASK